MSRRHGRGWGDGPIKRVPCTQEDLAYTKILPQREYHKFIIVKNPGALFSLLSLKLLSLRVDVYLLPMLTSWSQRSHSTMWTEFPQWVGRGYFKIVFAPSWQSVPQAWHLARKPVPLGTAVEQHCKQRVPESSCCPLPTWAHAHPTAGEWQGYGTMGACESWGKAGWSFSSRTPSNGVLE